MEDIFDETNDFEDEMIKFKNIIQNS